MSRGLPPWDPSLSDGCSVPGWLRALIAQEPPEIVAVCRDHDEAYYYGGSARARAIADAIFLLGLLKEGLDIDRAHRYHAAVRMFGGPHFRQPGESWAWGGGRFTYDEEAVLEAP